jgi:hypothetical protein
MEGHFKGNAFEPTGSLIKATLINSGRDMVGEPGFPGDREGWGAITLNDALQFDGSSHELWVKDVRHGDSGLYQANEADTYTLKVEDDSQPLKVTLVWADPAGAGGEANIVNNLDLVVQAPNTLPYPFSIFRGNNINSETGVSQPGGSADSVNNVEQVIIDAPQVGEWTVRTVASGINVICDCGQGYAIVATYGKPEPGQRLISSPLVRAWPIGLMILAVLALSLR